MPDRLPARSPGRLRLQEALDRLRVCWREILTACSGARVRFLLATAWNLQKITAALFEVFKRESIRYTAPDDIFSEASSSSRLSGLASFLPVNIT